MDRNPKNENGPNILLLRHHIIKFSWSTDKTLAQKSYAMLWFALPINLLTDLPAVCENNRDCRPKLRQMTSLPRWRRRHVRPMQHSPNARQGFVQASTTPRRFRERQARVVAGLRGHRDLLRAGAQRLVQVHVQAAGRRARCGDRICCKGLFLSLLQDLPSQRHSSNSRMPNTCLIASWPPAGCSSAWRCM